MFNFFNNSLNKKEYAVFTLHNLKFKTYEKTLIYDWKCDCSRRNY